MESVSLSSYIPQIILSVITLIVAGIVRLVTFKLINRYAISSLKLFGARLNQVLRICALIINFLAISTLITVWGVETENVFVALSSVFAVIGVALFAQWSILSNITAGLIMFFTSPFKVGDLIRILDKDFPIEAEIVNILTFYTHLETKDGQLHVFPNNLLLQKGVSIIKHGVVDKSKIDELK